LQVRIDSDGIDEEKDEYDNDIIHDKGKNQFQQQKCEFFFLRNFSQ
jgi:hypothetical protein